MSVSARFSLCHGCGHEEDYSHDFEIRFSSNPKPFITKPHAFIIRVFKTLEEMQRFEGIVNGDPIKYVPEGGDKTHFFMTRCHACGAIDRMEITKNKSTCHACRHEDNFIEFEPNSYDLYEFKTEADMNDFKAHYTGRP